MTTPDPRTRSSRPAANLVTHDIRFIRKGAAEFEPTVHCERRDCTLHLNECRSCERFARIDVHEGGYVMLCRSSDEPLDEDDVI